MDNKKRIALTFDDGPSKNTAELISLLSQYNAKATFFVIGKNVSSELGALLRSADLAGNEIGNHSYSHSPLSYLTEAELQKELCDTSIAAESMTGRRPFLARAPYGDLNDRVKELGRDLGISFIGWSLDTRDWDQKNRNEIYDFIISNARNGDIVLCHETQDETVEAMRSVLPRLRELGFELLTVTELLDPNGQGLVPGRLYCKAEEIKNEN